MGGGGIYKEDFARVKQRFGVNPSPPFFHGMPFESIYPQPAINLKWQS